MKALVRLSAVLPIVLLLCGCMTPDIVVVDDEGVPVAGVSITYHSLSISGPATTTDRRGRASIPWALQEIKWISVAKQGYAFVWASGMNKVDVNQPMYCNLRILNIEMNQPESIKRPPTASPFVDVNQPKPIKIVLKKY
jgi:hypothetical protein